MKITYNWLKEYIDFELSPQELARKLTNAGFEVEELIATVQDFSGVVVGYVEQVEKHPNADRLSVCQVSDGTESFQVICGASNVAEGQTVPFAKVGALLPKNFKIKKAKIRGVESYGMICSKEELGLEKTSDGIWALEKDWPRGADFHQLLAKEQDYIFDFFITPNRPDCLSLVGFAREVAAITGKPYRYPDVRVKEVETETIDSLISVKIQDKEGCPRYAARVIKNVKIGPSPQWMQQRLEAVGMRPINNIVDITNYVLMELGQPLHAFDLDRLNGAQIIVRSSGPGERFITLDEKERTLPENTVMICDKEKAVAIGGIMGGLNSEVTPSTVNILLESAYFTPTRIGPSAKRLGLISEASQRFERGTDPNGVLRAIDRAASLMSEYAGGSVVKGIADVYPNAITEHTIPLEPDKINRLLGTAFSEEQIKERLRALELKIENNQVNVPTFRVDLKIGVDLAEEVARLENYSNLPAKKATVIEYEQPLSENDKKISFFRRNLLELGLQEAFTSGMLNEKESAPFSRSEPLKILNPISDDMTVMRPSLLPGLLKAVRYNINRNNSDIRMFEIGRVFHGTGTAELPEQPYRLAFIISGRRHLDTWGGDEVRVDFYDIKGYLENLISKIFLDNTQFILYDKASYFSEKETLALQHANGEILGLCGRIAERVCSVFDIENAVYAVELELDKLWSVIKRERAYVPVPRFPYSEKDMALVCDENLQAGDIIDFVKETSGSLLREVYVFDVYRGENLAASKKSLAIKMRFQSTERTLSDEEVDKQFFKIIERVSKKFKASLRK